MSSEPTDQNSQKETRRRMQDFWDKNSVNASVEEMMLDKDAKTIGTSEIPELISLMPDMKAKRVVELGAGIGRFTGVIADSAKSVVAVDFMENFIKENQRLNGHKKNITFMAEDVTKLKFEDDSQDLVFSNWLLMYLNDEEVMKLIRNKLHWLQEGGHLFFRESCFHPSGSINNEREEKSTNPTYYRTPAFYSAILQSVSQSVQGEDDAEYGFELVFSRSVQTYIQMKNNPNQIWWLVRKVKRVHDKNNMGFKTFQEFLDSQQYTKDGILRYERVFGKYYVSTGGKETTVEMVDKMNLKPSQKVLDIGCGIGGSAFYMAQNFDVSVLGCDLSYNMIEIAMEYSNEFKDKRVQFEVSDATIRDFKQGEYDVVYSRDAILHIPDKLALFKSFLRWLKPGGKVLITDYCCSDGEHTDAFTRYVAGRGYHLLSPPSYGKVLEDAGFVNVIAEDRTEQFIKILEKELATMKAMKDEFIKDFGEEAYKTLEDGWTTKLGRVHQGDQRWGMFSAEKPCQ